MCDFDRSELTEEKHALNLTAEFPEHWLASLAEGGHSEDNADPRAHY